MKISIDCESCGGSQAVTQADLIALEQRLMSILTEPLATLTAALEGVKARVAALEANAVTPEDVAAVTAVATELDKVAVPVEPPPIEPPA